MMGLLQKLLPSGPLSLGACLGCGADVKRDGHHSYVEGAWWHTGCATGGYQPRRRGA